MISMKFDTTSLTKAVTNIKKGIAQKKHLLINSDLGERGAKILLTIIRDTLWTQDFAKAFAASKYWQPRSKGGQFQKSPYKRWKELHFPPGSHYMILTESMIEAFRAVKQGKYWIVEVDPSAVNTYDGKRKARRVVDYASRMNDISHFHDEALDRFIRREWNILVEQELKKLGRL